MNEPTVKQWIQKAEHDLKIGKSEMQTPDPATDMVCFHMQPCIEKYLIFHGRSYPKTHRLSMLIASCEETDPSFTELIEWDADELTSYATDLRYGEEFYMPDLEETRGAIELAERVRAFVREKLSQKGMSL